MPTKSLFRFIGRFLAAGLLTLMGCMEWDYVEEEDFNATGAGLFIVNQGNFQYGNATLSYYDPTSRRVLNEVFIRANGMKLGDTAQSMVIRNGLAWVVVNHSHVIFAINPDNFKLVGHIEGLTSPRYLLFVDDDKAYVSQLWDNRLFVVNPKTYQITGYIECPDMLPESGSTERMLRWGDYVLVTCWSYQNRLLKIDTRTDRVVESLELGIQPRDLVLDRNGKLWVMTDGGYKNSPYGYEAPALYRIDPASFTVERKWTFALGETPFDMQVSADGSTLYWINGGVWQMPVGDNQLPLRPLLPDRGTLYRCLGVHPTNGDIYVADAIDYQQEGRVYRYSASGELVDEFSVGVSPSCFVWK